MADCMQAVNAILSPDSTSDYDYLPFFYSRVFNLSWQASPPPLLSTQPTFLLPANFVAGLPKSGHCAYL